MQQADVLYLKKKHTTLEGSFMHASVAEFHVHSDPYDMWNYSNKVYTIRDKACFHASIQLWQAISLHSLKRRRNPGLVNCLAHGSLLSSTQCVDIWPRIVSNFVIYLNPSRCIILNLSLYIASPKEVFISQVSTYLL